MLLNKRGLPVSKPWHGPVPQLVGLGVLTALIAIIIAEPVAAQRNPQPKRAESAHDRPTLQPLVAVVALTEQRVTIYDANGKVLQAPVSTGQKGYETPAGIYSVLEKKREHYSNIYDDASMPFMQRLTWSGIALHAGVLPGSPASHGCIRLPHSFAEQFFVTTKIGLRVVVVPSDMSPVDISHPALFRPGPIRSEVALSIAADRIADESTRPIGHLPDTALTWRSIAAIKAMAANAAAKKAAEARRAAVKAESQAAGSTKAIRLVEGARRSAEAQLKQAERALEAVSSPAATQWALASKARVLERIGELDRLKADGQAKIDAAAAAREQAEAAETAKVAAQNEAKSAQSKTAPVSVFISRKTQKLYVRQAFKPVFESSLTIREPDTPVGTTIFTALDYTNEGQDVRWSALSMYAIAGGSEPIANLGSGHVNRGSEPTKTDLDAAKAILDRITVPQETVDRITEILSPGSSLIISDEVASRETGKGTDFVVLMSGEPQGGILVRRRNPLTSRYVRSFRRSAPGASSNPFIWW
jgi:hypothetical protein